MTDEDFKPEPPTEPFSMQYRAARLIKWWAACTPDSQKIIERMAARLASLVKPELK